MENHLLLQELENIAARLDIAIRYEEGDFKDGFCRVKSEQVIIINKKYSTEQKITALSRVLSTQDLTKIYILPKLRERIYDETVAEEKNISE